MSQQLSHKKPPLDPQLWYLTKEIKTWKFREIISFLGLCWAFVTRLTDFRVHLAQVVHDAIEIKFARAEDHVLTRLLHFGRDEWVALVDLTKSVQHLGKLWWIDWFHRNLHHWLRVKLQRSKDKRLTFNRKFNFNSMAWVGSFIYFVDLWEIPPLRLCLGQW